MSESQRYKIFNSEGLEVVEGNPDDFGEWIERDDHDEEIERLTAINAELLAACELAVSIDDVSQTEVTDKLLAAIHNANHRGNRDD